MRFLYRPRTWSCISSCRCSFCWRWTIEVVRIVAKFFGSIVESSLMLGVANILRGFTWKCGIFKSSVNAPMKARCGRLGLIEFNRIYPNLEIIKKVKDMSNVTRWKYLRHLRRSQLMRRRRQGWRPSWQTLTRQWRRRRRTMEAQRRGLKVTRKG